MRPIDEVAAEMKTAQERYTAAREAVEKAKTDAAEAYANFIALTKEFDKTARSLRGRRRNVLKA